MSSIVSYIHAYEDKNLQILHSGPVKGMANFLIKKRQSKNSSTALCSGDEEITESAWKEPAIKVSLWCLLQNSVAIQSSDGVVWPIRRGISLVSENQTRGKAIGVQGKWESCQSNKALVLDLPGGIFKPVFVWIKMRGFSLSASSADLSKNLTFDVKGGGELEEDSKL